MAVLATTTATPRLRRAVSPSCLDDPDVALMLRVQRDERGAFAALIERHWSQIFGRFYRRLCDRQEAEDLAQEVFLRLYRHRKRYRPTAKFATWLFHITQNVLRNAIRARRRHPSVRLDAVPYLCREDADGCRWLWDRGESPSQPLERAELRGLVRAAVATLADRSREALVSHQFEDRSCAEIAAEMDMTPKAAKSLLYRARKQLRASLNHLVDET